MCSRAPIIVTSSVWREVAPFETLHLRVTSLEINTTQAALVVGSTDPSVHSVMSCFLAIGVR